MIRKSVVAVVGAGLLIGLAACGSSSTSAPSSSESSSSAVPVTSAAFPVTVTDCARDVTVEAAPTRAITMNQGATEVMLALDLQKSMVGTAYLDDSVADKWKSAYDGVPVLATEYPNQEAVLAADPDFVYASYSSAFDPEAAGSVDELEKLGIASYVSPFGCEDKALRPEISFDSVWAEISDIGSLFGVTDRSEALVAEQKADISAAEVASAGTGLDVFWYDSGTKTPTAGAGFGSPELIIDSVGAKNIFADVEGGWTEVSWEKVVAADPDVIVLADASWDTAEQKEKYLESDPALKDLTAVKNKQYVILPFSETTAGVRTADGVVSMADQLTALTK